MRICKEHWQMCREAVAASGMNFLISTTQAEVMEKVMGSASESEMTAANFDPLLQLNDHFCHEALRCGGQAVLGNNGTGENGGHFCPICLFEENQEGFTAEEVVPLVVCNVSAQARQLGLMTRLQ